MHIIQRVFVIILAATFALDLPYIPVARAQETGPDAAPENPWPRTEEKNGAKLEMFQPQPELFEGNRLRVRAAVSIVLPGETEPQFGAVWFEARVVTDRDEREVSIQDIKVDDVRFPTAPEGSADKLKAYLTEKLKTWESAQISLDRLVASLGEAEVRVQQAKGLKTDPPKIIFVTEPTELVIIDGEPELRPVENSKVMKVINTVFFILLEPQSKAYFLNLGKIWMTAPEMKGPWKQSTNPPAEIVALTPKPDPEAEEEAGEDEGIVPRIIVTTEAVEMITTDGEPKYQVLPNKDLLFVSNTDSSVFRELATQEIYAQISGRWFKTRDLKKGPWTYVAPDALPKSFQAIPADSDVGDVRAFVPGTEEAKDAVLDAQIPQTQTVKRDETITVEYDGEPKFEPVEKTNLKYAVNTADQVILEAKDGVTQYYCCRDGVWYVSANPKGPYAVATEAPTAINDVPPESPVYNTKYVYVYSSTPSVVYVGYTPAYHGCYVYGGTVVYGTGYVYRGWCGLFWFGRPYTYGYHRVYYPGVGRWFSPYSVGGVVRRTRRRTRRRTHYRHHHGSHYRGGHGGSRYSNRSAAGKRAASASATGRRASRNAHQDKVNRNTNKKQNQSNRSRNNTYADKSGNVHRKNSSGSWESKNKSGWSSSDRKTSSSMDRSSKSRDRGSSRTNSYNKSRSSSRSRSSGGRSGGGRSGGGGRR